MVVFNPLKREIDIKIVYYGPAQCGKTTNLQVVHKLLNPSQRGELVSLATKDDRTLFFDFLPIELDGIKGFKTRFHVYTVPGQVLYTLTRRAVLTGVDGVIFVVDSQVDKMEENLESLNDLKENLGYYKKDLASIPFVIQYNKRDLKNLIPVEELEKELNTLMVPSFTASAVNGKGVMETLTMCCRMVLKQIRNKSREKKVAAAEEELHEQEKRTIENVISELPRLRLVDTIEQASMVEEEKETKGDELQKGSEKTLSPVEARPSANEEITFLSSPGEALDYDLQGGAEEEGDFVPEEEKPPFADLDALKGGSREHSVDVESKRGCGTSLRKDEEVKSICPRCSLKFKSNVKQCPICKIGLVVEGVTQDDIQHTSSEESCEKPSSLEETRLGNEVTLVECGQPQKISDTGFKIPLIMKVNGTGQELLLSLSIDFEDFVFKLKQSL